MACLLFCTHEVPAERISNLIQKVIDFEEHNDCMNPVCLVRNPDQHEFENPTPIPVQPFETGFLGYSIEELGNFVKAHSPVDGGNIESELFAVMDERSLHDDTLVVACWLEEFVQDDHGNYEYGEENVIGESWVVRRVKFHQLSAMVSLLSDPELAMAYRTGEEAMISDDGVFSLPSSHMASGVNHPDDPDVLPRDQRL